MAKSIKVVRPSKLVLWNALVTKAHRSIHAGYKSHWLEQELIKAIYQAEGNANDTINDEFEGGAAWSESEYEERFAELSYGSLSMTGPFDGNKEVRAFFENLGYTW